MQKRSKFMIIPLLIILIIIFRYILIENNERTIRTNAEGISNKKIGWGIKRNNEHQQPEMVNDITKILDENNGIYLGNKDDKTIYLTFDEGYEAGYTKDILKVLKDNEIKAAFFLTAHYLNTEPELVKQMIDEGHIVGNHTVNHKSMPDLSEDEIKKEILDLHQSIYEKFDYEMKYIRPPKGEFSERTVKISDSLGYKTVMWSFAYEDWDEKNQPSHEKAIKKIEDNFHNGEIILLHGNSKTNLEVLDEVIKKAKEEGYEFKSLDEFK